MTEAWGLGFPKCEEQMDASHGFWPPALREAASRSSNPFCKTFMAGKYAIKSIVVIDFININGLASFLPHPQINEFRANPLISSDLFVLTSICEPTNCAANCASKRRKFPFRE